MRPAGETRRHYFIDTGTTNPAMAEALPAELALTVVTNSPEIAAVLVKSRLRRGDARRPAVAGKRGCVGAAAVAQVQGMLFDRGLSAAAPWRQSQA